MRKNYVKEYACRAVIKDWKGVYISQHLFDSLFPDISKTEVIDSDEHQILVVRYPICSTDQVLETSICGVYTPIQNETVDEIAVPPDTAMQLGIDFMNDVVTIFGT